MNRDEAVKVARGVYYALPATATTRLKAIHVMGRLHQGHLTIRVFMHPHTADDPPEIIVTKEEL